MDFSNFLHGFAKLINFTKFLNRFVKVATRICQSCSICFFPLMMIQQFSLVPMERKYEECVNIHLPWSP